MQCNAIQVTGHGWSWKQVDIGEPKPGEVLVDVAYSSLCGTDKDIINGSLCYYKDGTAQYPIVTGHEWCGLANGKPVTGICILPCESCLECLSGKSPMHCQFRKEVGVVNKHGAHADYIIMPEKYLVPIPEVSPKWSLVEPTAVVINGLNKVDLSLYSNILITGYGTIGRICKDIIESMDMECNVYDPKYGHTSVNYSYFDLLIECSGNKNALTEYISSRGGSVLAFGFDYADSLGDLVSNDIKFIGTIGSSRTDFVEAVDNMCNITSVDFDIMNIENFGDALKHKKKVVFEHGV